MLTTNANAAVFFFPQVAVGTKPWRRSCGVNGITPAPALEGVGQSRNLDTRVYVPCVYVAQGRWDRNPRAKTKCTSICGNDAVCVCMCMCMCMCMCKSRKINASTSMHSDTNSRLHARHYT